MLLLIQYLTTLAWNRILFKEFYFQVDQNPQKYVTYKVAETDFFMV